jgi:DNA polymerase III epsilon subunit-like protein
MATMNVSRIRSLDPKKVIVIDTETTGKKPQLTDEILSLTILDLDGNVLFDELVKPERRKRWPKAQELHGITWSMVKDKELLLSYREQLQEIWDGAELVVGYNVGFDMEFLYEAGIYLKHVPEFDVMREFAPIWGRWDEYHGDWRWSKLEQCAKYYGIADFDAHSSRGDAEATRQCFLALLDDDEYRVICEKREEKEREIQEALRKAEKQRVKEEEAKKEDIKRQNRGCLLALAVTVLVLVLLMVGCVESCRNIFG